jgi:xanthine dehydrogenase accessory factor
VVVVDDAKTATEESFPDAKIYDSPYPKSLELVEIRPTDFVAILHGETQFEISALRHALRSHPAYLGLLGSSNKARSHRNQMLEEGFDQRDMENIHAPIGIEIEAETPEEIGVSIVAEMIRVRKEKSKL